MLRPSTPCARAFAAARHAVLALLVTLAVASPAFAQDTIDRVPPTIAFEPLGEGRRGDTQVFSARVDDEESEIERVTFHYRAAGTSVYALSEMTPLAGTSIYTVSIDDLGPEVSAIEFYIDAIDEAGNRSIEGFAFDPLVRALVGPDAAPDAEVAETQQSETPIETDGLSTGRKVLYGVLGVVVIGALAAAAGGGGDDGDDGGGDDVLIDVPVVADPL